jgi:hypothetical protein
MDISSVISSSVAQTVATTGSQRVVFSIIPPTTASSIEISGLGQLLSASTLFETGNSNAANQAGFPAVLAATQIFANALNNFLQTDSLQNASAGSPGNQFMQALNTQTTAGSEKSIIASLSGIGINYQAPVSQNDTGRMTIDFKTLQSAFNTNPAGTTSLLAQATQSIGQFAAKFRTLFTPLNNLAQNSQPAAATAAAISGTTVTPGTAATPATAGTNATATTETAAAITSATAATSAARIAIATAATALTASEIAATTAQPATTALPSTTQATSGSTATPTASSLPIVATPATLLTATAVPAAALPAATSARTGIITPTETRANVISPVINASDPAIAAAIASYHLIDGIFDTAKPHDEGLAPATYSYSKIGPVAPIQPIRLDLHA